MWNTSGQNTTCPAVIKELCRAARAALCLQPKGNRKRFGWFGLIIAAIESWAAGVGRAQDGHSIPPLLACQLLVTWPWSYTCWNYGHLLTRNGGRCLGNQPSSSHGGFHSHAGTHSYHPCIDGLSMNNKPSILIQLLGIPHWWKPPWCDDLDQPSSTSQVSDSLLQQSIAETSAPKQRRLEHKELQGNWSQISVNPPTKPWADIGEGARLMSSHNLIVISYPQHS